MARRKAETLSVYRPLPVALKFHRDNAYWRLGIGSNRSGKTQCGALEVAFAATGLHPFINYPKERGTIYVVGYDGKHIREVMWPKLAAEGSMKFIRDEDSGEWRPVYPDNEYDLAYKEKWKDAPPVLPPRLVKSITWNKKNEEIPSIVTMVNGTKLHFFSSRARPQKGTEIDLGWFDEELENEIWIPEMEARAIDKGGRLIWTFTPEVATEMAFTMHQRAEAPGDEYDVSEYKFLIKENPHISEANKLRFRKNLRTQREIDTKWHGKFALQGRMVYPEYTEDDHHVKPFEIPPDWCRYMFVDPGVQVCAVLFVAVPPPNHAAYEKEVHFYDELYIRRCSARMFGQEVARKMGHLKNRGFCAFIIDEQFGQQSEMDGTTIQDTYEKALIDEGVESQTTGSSFLPGSKDKLGRESALRNWLDFRHDTAAPTLRVHKNKCPYFDWEMGRQFYKIEKINLTPVVTDKRVDKDNHIVTCGEYAAEMEPAWVRPPRGRRTDSRIMKKIRELNSAVKSSSFTMGPHS